MVVFDPEQLSQIVVEHEPHEYHGVKGSIVSLKVHDFMTYHKVSIRAGPNVNLILGPNGTGKSAIVCAICIGLAGKPSILGRARSLKEYIRHDCSSASIEIELYNPEGQNWVIRRLIKATKEKAGANSTWYLGGKKVTQNSIDSLLNKLNIQLDNLCQFLPQDRVQEFSKMDSQSLLESTQKAMGKDTLIQKHDTLQALRKEMVDTEGRLNYSSDNLRTEQQTNQRLENEVQNFQRREELKKLIVELKGKKAWVIYLKAVGRFSTAQSQQKALLAAKKEQEGKLAPLKNNIKSMEGKLGSYNREISSRRNTNVHKAVKKKYEEEYDRVEVKVNEMNSELEAVEKQERDRQKNVEAAVMKVRALEAEMAKFDNDCGGPEASKMENLEKELKVVEAAFEKASFAVDRVSGDNTSDEQEARGISERITRLNRDKERLGDLKVSRMKFLQRERNDIFKAVEFFEKEENKAKLRGRIHEPMILHMTVDDLKYGPMLEKHIGIDTMTSFFCENKDDLEVMLRLMKDNGKLRIAISHHEAPPGDWQRPRSILSDAWKREFHFHSTLMDHIQVPDYYLSFLLKKLRLNDVPIGASPKTDEKFNDISHKISHALQSFYTDTNAYHMRKSNYGGGVCSSVEYLHNARIFTSEINAHERERLEKQVGEAEVLLATVRDRVRERKRELDALEAVRKEKNQTYTEARSKVSVKRQLINKMKSALRGKEQLDRDVPDLEELREKTKTDTWNERQKLIVNLEWSLKELNRCSGVGGQLILLKRQYHALQSRITAKSNLLEELQTNINENMSELKTLELTVSARAAEADAAKKDAIEISKVQSPPKGVENAVIDDVNKDITQAESQIGFLVDTDSSIVKDYEERKKKIEKLLQERGFSQAKLEEVKKEIEIKKKEWLDPLEALITRINDNFGRFFASMGCAGEVKLCHDDDENDFAKYGIKIMVKFRNSEPLAEMCGNRVGTLQSGGERVITTALYVLALQELTVVPFRVIDEINQGMDSRNESRFFNLLCSLAKGANTPQYFLLTPKMLPPVDYPDNVDFHFIMNGPKVNVPLNDDDEETSSEEEEDDDEDGDEEEEDDD